MSEEWRVEVDLDDEEHGYTIGERLRSLPIDEEATERLGGRAIVTRDGSKLFVYTDSEAAAAEADAVVRELLAEHRLTASIHVTRYHPVEGAWKDPSVRLPATEEEKQAEYQRKEAAGLEQAARHGEFPWEVRVDLPDLESAVALNERLAAEELPAHRRWRHVLVGQPTEEAANALAERLRSELDEAEAVTVEAHDVRYPVFMLLGSAT